MKMLLFLLLLGIVGPHCTSARTHSLKYFYTGSSGVPNFPEFVTVGLVDEVPISHYDSNTKRVEPKQDWMNKITAEDPEYWERQTELRMDSQLAFKVNIETAKQRFNLTGGVHILQRMYGCDWDDQTGEVKGYDHYGFDGEDFMILDLETDSWITPTPEAVLSKHRGGENKPNMDQWKYLSQWCPEYLKKYVHLGRSFLMRTEIPSVSLLQKSPSSPVSCHASGFYPDRAAMFWTRDGEELHDNVDHGEILPNHDGSFQMSVDLDVSSFPAEHWDKYRCVFQLSGVKEDHVIVLDPAVIRTNRRNPLLLLLFIGAALFIALLIAGIVFLVYRKRNANRNNFRQL
ncbi:major histocompatibility complex class I-related gene protein-like [Trematomus bernacchii]|uniref:major histocompatibility complex class I-related gene protein-like n=1 Tax=Trematomus bernacchii TaxID=40690 RepID=UPI00146EAB44|nr:major histocompatibility complex class I-related gene protein-like [Trematomus bernacchii]